VEDYEVNSIQNYSRLMCCQFLTEGNFGH